MKNRGLQPALRRAVAHRDRRRRRELPSWDGEPLDLDWTVDALRRTSVAR